MASETVPSPTGPVDLAGRGPSLPGEPDLRGGGTDCQAEAARSNMLERLDKRSGMLPNCRLQVNESLSDPAWDEFVAVTPGGHHVQTSCWARIKATLGWQAARVLALEGERILAGAQLLIRPIPLVGSVGYVTKGPLIPNGDLELASAILNQIIELGRCHRCQLLAIQPPKNGAYLAQVLESHGFRVNPLELGSTASLVLELEQGPGPIKEQLTKETRRNIGRSERAGIIVQEGSSADLDSFYALYHASARRQGFLPYRRDYFEALWEAFAPRGWVTLMLARFEAEIVSAQLLIPFGNLVMAKMVGWAGMHAKRYPNEALLWSSILWAVSHGYRYFDFEGLNLQVARSRVSGSGALPTGPDAFKYGFGGQVEFYPPTYVYLPNKVFAWCYHRIPCFIDKGERGHLVECLRKR